MGHLEGPDEPARRKTDLVGIPLGRSHTISLRCPGVRGQSISYPRRTKHALTRALGHGAPRPRTPGRNGYRCLLCSPLRENRSQADWRTIPSASPVLMDTRTCNQLGDLGLIMLQNEHVSASSLT